MIAVGLYNNLDARLCCSRDHHAKFRLRCFVKMGFGVLYQQQTVSL